MYQGYHPPVLDSTSVSLLCLYFIPCPISIWNWHLLLFSPSQCVCNRPVTMTSADFSRQALLRDSECCIALATSVRPPQALTRSFPLIPAPFTAGVPCSYWTLVCLATSSTLHSLSGQLLQASGLPPASFRPHLAVMPLPLAAPFPLPGGSGTFTP